MKSNPIPCLFPLCILLVSISCDSAWPQRFRPRLRDPRVTPRPSATNKEEYRSLSRRAQRFSMRSSTNRKHDGGTRRALLIATRHIGRKTATNEIANANRDAERLLRKLHRAGFKRSDISIVFDNAADPQDLPTKKNIVEHLARLEKGADRSDVVLIFLIGPGVSVDDESFFRPMDATDRAVDDLTSARRELVPISDFVNRLSQKCKAFNKLLVVDAVQSNNEHSSGFVRGLREAKNGVWVITGCSEGQVSRTKRSNSYGAFSYYFGEGIAGAADLLGNNDGKVGLAEIYSYVYQKTVRVTPKSKVKQTPELFGFGPQFKLSEIVNSRDLPTLTTSNGARETRRTAKLIAKKSLKNIRESSEVFRTGFSRQLRIGNSRRLASVVEQHEEEMQRTFLAYTNVALDLDNHCQLALIAKGIWNRRLGHYKDALRSFKQADENFYLFTRGRPNSLQPFIAYENGKLLRDAYGNLVLRADLQAWNQPSDSIVVYEKPDLAGPHLDQRIEIHSKVLVDEVRDDWVRIIAVNDRELNRSGWLPVKDVHWLDEAAELYTPDSPMCKFRSTLGILKRVSRLFGELVSKSDLEVVSMLPRRSSPSETLTAVNRINRRYNAFSGSIPLVSIPNYPHLISSRTANYVTIPTYFGYVSSSYLKVSDGFVRIPESISVESQSWGRATNDFYLGLVRSEFYSRLKKGPSQSANLLEH